MKDTAETRALYNTTAIDIAGKLNAVRKAVHGEQKTAPAPDGRALSSL